MKKGRSHPTPLPALRPQAHREFRALAIPRPTVLPSVGGTRFSIFYGVALALIALWLLVLTWMFQTLHG
ncbi:hypothetical protein AZ34_13390 [Hylemonella gracilis str. Niagara R]|uniref:Uncharacterized protein n=1 Tax=Hylemonella gracilis str. Niagara R TaxID=1458275 RepID=A0A016XMX1_9BURK|nr:hypothetical protein AZ34_13390 [Hylemonella gracilis str. Niagara R]